MTDIKFSMPKVPEIRYKKCKRCLNKTKVPTVRLPRLKTAQSMVMRGIIAGLIVEVTKVNSIKHQKTGKQETPVIGAGRGGKYSSKVSSMGRMAESAQGSQKREKVPLKKTGTFHSILPLSYYRNGGM